MLRELKNIWWWLLS